MINVNIRQANQIISTILRIISDPSGFPFYKSNNSDEGVPLQVNYESSLQTADSKSITSPLNIEHMNFESGSSSGLINIDHKKVAEGTSKAKYLKFPGFIVTTTWPDYRQHEGRVVFRFEVVLKNTTLTKYIFDWDSKHEKAWNVQISGKQCAVVGKALVTKLDRGDNQRHSYFAMVVVQAIDLYQDQIPKLDVYIQMATANIDDTDKWDIYDITVDFQVFVTAISTFARFHHIELKDKGYYEQEDNVPSLDSSFIEL